MRSLFLLSFASLFALEELDEMKLHSLYLMQQGRVEESIAKYREFVDLKGRNDFEALQQMGLILLQKGMYSQEPQDLVMTLFGAGLSGSTGALDILEKGLSHSDPQMQVLSLHFIARFDDDRASELFNRAMSSDYLGVRMEAAYHLARRKHPHAVGQVEGLMVRLPPVFKPHFPSLFALVGTSDAIASLRRLMEDLDPQTRVEAILNAAKLGRDDLLPTLRKRLSHTHVAEMEAAAFAVGILQDSHSIPKLKRLAENGTDSIRLCAAIALTRLGDRSFIPTITEMAQNANLFAIAALGEISETQETLAPLLNSGDLQVKMNAAIALLQRRDPRCVNTLAEILIQDQRGMAFHPFVSVGRTMSAIKAVPSADLRASDQTLDLSYSLAMREHYLKQAALLPEPDFLRLAQKILQRPQNDLVPTLIALLENLQTDEAIALLKQGASSLTSPLIRNYCHLALYRLKEEGPHEEYMKNWLSHQGGQEMIQLRPLLPWKFRMEQSDYTLSTEETSRLLIETVVSIASMRDEKSIAFLLEAIQHGNPHNRYALMGLLMNATE